MGRIVFCLIGSVLRLLLALSVFCFLFAAFNCQDDWWINRSPWAATRENARWNLKYHALQSRQHESEEATQPMLLGSNVCFRVRHTLSPFFMVF